MDDLIPPPSAGPPPRLPVGDSTTRALGAWWRRVGRPDEAITRRVLSVAWPVVLTNLLASLALTVDLAFVGTLGPEALAAAGVASMVFFVAMTVGTGLGAGATALVGRAIGAGDVEEAGRATSAAVMLTLLVSIPIVIMGIVFAEPMMHLMGAEASIVEGGALILRLLAWGVPGNLVILTLSGAFQGAGDTRPALLVGIGVNVVNLGLDYVLIFGKYGFPEMGLAGAGYATAVSYLLGGFAFLVVVASGFRPVRLRHPTGRTLAVIRRITRVGAPAGVESLLLTIGFTAYLILILQFGASALAAHQIGLRIQSFAFMPGFGFAAAASALVSQGLGRGDPVEAERNGWVAMAMGFVVMMVVSVPLVFVARPIVGLFTADAEALELGVTWMRIIVIAMPAIALHFTAAGALRGAGDTRWPLAVSFAGLWLVRLPVAWVLGVVLGWGMLGLWAAYVVEYYGRAIVVTWRYARGGWKSLKV